MDRRCVEAMGIIIVINLISITMIARRSVVQITRWSTEAATGSDTPRDNAPLHTPSSRVVAKTKTRARARAREKDGKGTESFGPKEARAMQVNHQHTLSMRARLGDMGRLQQQLQQQRRLQQAIAIFYTS